LVAKKQRRTPEEIRNAAARILRIKPSRISQQDAKRFINANSLKSEDCILD